MRLSIGNANKRGDIAMPVQQRVHLHGAFALPEFRPRKQRQAEIDSRRIEERTDSDRGPRRSDRERTRVARCRSGPGRNRHRCASRESRWRRREWSATRGRGTPCGTAWRSSSADTLRHRASSRDRLTARRPSPDIGPGRKILAREYRRDTARHTSETRRRVRDR